LAASDFTNTTRIGWLVLGCAEVGPQPGQGQKCGEARRIIHRFIQPGGVRSMLPAKGEMSSAILISSGFAMKFVPVIRVRLRMFIEAAKRFISNWPVVFWRPLSGRLKAANN